MAQMRRAAVGFLFALGIIGLFTWVVGWDDILAVLSRATLRWTILGLGLGFGSLLLLGAAWWEIVGQTTDLSYLSGIRIFFAADFSNAITPLGQFGGEPFIAYILSKHTDMPYEESLGAVLAADVMNAVQFFTLTLFGILTFLLFFPLEPLISLISKIVIAMGLVLALVFLLIWHNEEHVITLWEYLGNVLEEAIVWLGLETDGVLSHFQPDVFREKGENFFEMLRQLLEQRRRVAKALILSHLAGIAGTLGLYFIILGFGHDVPISALLFIMPASMLAGYLPLPGGLGGIEVALTGLLAAVTGIPASVASAAALLFRISTYWMQLLIGGYFASHLSVDVFETMTANNHD